MEGIVITELAGQPLHATDIPRDTGCTIIGIVRDGSCVTAFDPAAALPANAQLWLTAMTAPRSGSSRAIPVTQRCRACAAGCAAWPSGGDPRQR